MRVSLLLNPASGSAPDPEELTDALRRHGAERVELFPVDAAGDALEPRPDRLVVAGGDGSIGPAAAAAAKAGVPLAVVPAGTANDFARAVGLPDDLDDACRIAVTATPLAHDLAWIGERPFVNVANAGVAVQAAQAAGPWKRVLGALAYPVGAIRAGVSAQPVRCTVRCDGDLLFDGRAWQLLIGNSNAFGGGAGMDMGNARDGVLSVAIVPQGSRLALARHAHALRFGDLRRQAGVVRRQGTEVTVDGPNPLVFNVDGEIVEVGTSVALRIEPGAFELAVDD
ncbi:MAG TPA: diacylglycerol kinase family protein [Gaiellales bacterium]|nr:diacylglycerol kinase family protein [Gaiellales bacterium]